jgi:ABC-type Fe3+/spermidine/putrescine transport system ATPase subunit
MSAVAFAGISKRFGGVEALHPIDFEIASGEFVSLLGPSGSGKTTLLNICAGYLEPSSGRLLVQGRDITREPPRRRKVGMVFQNYALFPHMTVFRNIAYGLEARGLPRTEIDRRVGAALARVRLDGFADRNVRELSGGQQQRVALARAVVIEPDILLMDEPLGALDRQLRKDVQLEIRRMHVAAPRTTLYVTHDQEEALVMSDRIAVMRAGRIVQSGTSQDLYALRVEGLTQPVEGRAAPGLAAGGAGSALIRPEHVKPMPSGMPARIVERVFLGEIVALRLALAAGPELWSRRFGAEAPSGDHVEIGWDRDAVSILPDAT